MSTYNDRIEAFNQSLDDARQHADTIAGQIENLKAINRDSTSSLFDKVNDSVGGVGGAIGSAAQLYHTYKHGQVLTFLERHDINTALGKAGNGGIKNAGNETLNTIDQLRNAPTAGLSPNSAGIQLPDANQIASSLKGRIIGNEAEGASQNDLGQLVGRTTALQDKADNISGDALKQVLSTNAPQQELKAPSAETNLDTLDQAQQAQAAVRTAPTENITRNFLSKSLPEEGAGKALADAEQPIGSSILGETATQLKPISITVPEELPSAAEPEANEVVNAGSIAGKIGKSIGNTLGKLSGEGGGEAIADSVATGMEAAAPETGALAPLVATVGGLVALGSSIAKMFHKNKPPPPVVAPPPAPATQIGADLSVVK